MQGFCRWQCSDCRHERLVPYRVRAADSARSCGGKRMTDIAHLVDHIILAVPVRQFMLSLPHWLRYRLAYDHDHCIAVLAIFIRTLLGFYRKRAKRRGVHNGCTGSVTFIQRFGSAANLNVHLHALVLDGVFTNTPSGQLAFHPAPPPTTPEVAQLLTTARQPHQHASYAQQPRVATVTPCADCYNNQPRLDPESMSSALVPTLVAPSSLRE